MPSIYRRGGPAKKPDCETREDLFIRHIIGAIVSYSTGRLTGTADD